MHINLFCIIFFINIFSIKIHCQDFFAIGIKSGLNLPNTYSKTPDLSKLNSDNKKTTIIAGIFGSYQIDKWLAIKMEVFYEERGWLVPNSIAFDTVKQELVTTNKNIFYSFITIPVMAQFSVGDKFRAFLNTGMNISYRVDGKIKTDAPNTLGDVPTLVRPNLLKPLFDVGAVANIGVQIPVFQSFFILSEARYYRSFSGIGLNFIEKEINHHGFIFSGGIGYSFGKN